MKKILFIFVIAFLFFTSAYAETEYEYSDWTQNETGYPYEESKIMYGYKYPIKWSSWSDIKEGQPFARMEMMPFPTAIPNDKSHWYYKGVQTLYSWPEYGEYPEPKTLLAWGIDIDACDNRNYDISHYYEPKMELVCTLDTNERIVVGSTPGRGGNEYNLSINMFGSGEYKCKKVSLNMVEALPTYGNYSSINIIGTVYSYISFKTPCYSHVIEWSKEGIGWKGDGPYINVDKDGDGNYDDPILPVDGLFYRHPLYYYIDYHPGNNDFDVSEFNDLFHTVYPNKYYVDNKTTCLINNDESCFGRDKDNCLFFKDNTYCRSPYIKGYAIAGFYDNREYSGNNIYKITGKPVGDIVLYPKLVRLPPSIDVEQRYIFEDDTIETIKDLASANDELDGDISSDVVIKTITYDDTGESYDYPSTFDPYVSDTIHITYEVINSGGVKEEKIVKLYILKDGIFVNLKIYDRYISKEYINTLDNNSVWKSSDYNKTLQDAINWLEGK